MVIKMVGKKGRSGRKTRDDGLKARAVALYIAHMEWQNLATGKTEHTPVGWFQQFKRIYGNRWQEKVRTLIQIQVRRIKMKECGHVVAQASQNGTLERKHSVQSVKNGLMRTRGGYMADNHICKNCGKPSCRRKRQHARPPPCYCMCPRCNNG